MKTLETIYKKLNSVKKTELETHKVELAIADDIQKTLAALKAALNETEETLKFFEKTKSDFLKAEKIALKVRSTAGSKSKKAFKISEKAQAVMAKTEKAASDLGVNPSAIKGYSELDDLSVEVEDKGMDIDRFDFDLGQ